MNSICRVRFNLEHLCPQHIQEEDTGFSVCWIFDEEKGKQRLKWEHTRQTWHFKVLSSTSRSKTWQNRPNGGYFSWSPMWQRLDDISVSANSLLSVLLLCLSSLKCFLFPPVHADSWESRDLQQRRNITSVLKREEESIKVPCEKFPESMKGEECQICSRGYVRILTSTSTCKDVHAHTHTQTLTYDLIH